MDMNTIQALRAANAGIILTLASEPVRATFKNWVLYASFEIVGTNGKKIVPAKIKVLESRYRGVIESELARLDLTYLVSDLADFSQNDLCGSAVSCQLPCPVCGKTDLDLSTGCANPSIFSPAVGDWVCNLVTFEVSK